MVRGVYAAKETHTVLKGHLLSVRVIKYNQRFMCMFCRFYLGFPRVGGTAATYGIISI